MTDATESSLDRLNDMLAERRISQSEYDMLRSAIESEPTAPPVPQAPDEIPLSSLLNELEKKLAYGHLTQSEYDALSRALQLSTDLNDPVSRKRFSKAMAAALERLDVLQADRRISDAECDQIRRVLLTAADPVSRTAVRLCKSTHGRMLGGVCAGLSEYLEIRPFNLRIGFVLLALATAHHFLCLPALVIYAVLYLCLPWAKQPEPAPYIRVFAGVVCGLMIANLAVATLVERQTGPLRLQSFEMEQMLERHRSRDSFGRQFESAAQDMLDRLASPIYVRWTLAVQGVFWVHPVWWTLVAMAGALIAGSLFGATRDGSPRRVLALGIFLVLFTPLAGNAYYLCRDPMTSLLSPRRLDQ